MKALTWVLLGVVLALMLAPRSGAATRREVIARINQAFGAAGS